MNEIALAVTLALLLIGGSIWAGVEWLRLPPGTVSDRKGQVGLGLFSFGVALSLLVIVAIVATHQLIGDPV